MNNRWLAPIAFISGLFISAVAAYFSILGLTKLFASAAMAVAILGVSIEIGKLVSASWLFHNWKIAPRLLKGYMASAVVVLMLITSLGIWGYLNKSYADQTAPMTQTNIELTAVRAEMKTQEDRIKSANIGIDQINRIVSRKIEDTKTDTSLAAVRQTRQQLSSYETERKAAQNKLAELRQQEAKLTSANQTIAHEVGPINYIARALYGDTEQTTVDKAVQIVIVLLVLVFDPLAIALLLAANFSLGKRPVEIEEVPGTEFTQTGPPDEQIWGIYPTTPVPPAPEPVHETVTFEEVSEPLQHIDETEKIGEVIYHDDGTKSIKG
jgi:hypothetical protein